MSLPKSLTKEYLAEKSEKELLEINAAYAAESNNYLRRISMNVQFFFWIFCVFMILAIVVVGMNK
ncbi:hypothetical protein [Flavobacterium rhizosphaerae]|uniref:Uncharacterized protein n=1 Tax=Flavobacterium rhizosphaerae TaxID=3163298 RepID=A0ABW8YWX9_9FLAO